MLIREELWLRAFDAGVSIEELCRASGLGQARIYRGLQRARLRREEGLEEYHGDRDRFDFTYMEIVSRLPEYVALHPWCTPSGLTSEERGTYHVGGQVRSLRGGRPVDRSEDGEEPSEKGRVNDSDKARGVVYAQRVSDHE